MSNIRFDYSKALPFVGQHEIDNMAEYVKEAHNMLHNKTGACNDFLGWVNLPTDYENEEFARIKKAAEMKNVVIATGGGVVLNEQNIEKLRKTGVIFNLSPDFSVIRERLEEARKTRPLLKQDSIENNKKRFDDRKPFYDNCDYKINVIHGRTPRSYAMEILEIMESRQGAEKQ